MVVRAQKHLVPEVAPLRPIPAHGKTTKTLWPIQLSTRFLSKSERAWRAIAPLVCLQPMYFIPYKTELTEHANKLGNIKTCKYALMTLLWYRKSAWDTWCLLLAVDKGTIPEHHLKGKENVWSKKFKLDVESGLKEFFERVELPLSGPRPTRFTREESGTVTWDLEDIKELDPEGMKQCLLGKYCYDLGYTVAQTVNRAVKISERVDKDYSEGCDHYGRHCSLTAFWNDWKEHHGNIVVRKPSRDPWCCVNLAHNLLPVLGHLWCGTHYATHDWLPIPSTRLDKKSW